MSGITSAAIVRGKKRTEIRLTIRHPKDPGDVKDEWEALLVAGALRDRSHARGLPEIGARALVYRWPSGREEEGVWASLETFFHGRLANDSSCALTRRIKARLRSFGLTPVSISFARPWQLAPIVVARADEGAVLPDGTLEREVLPDWERFEGRYLEIVDRNGKRVYVGASSTRTASGMGSGGVGTLSSSLFSSSP